MVVDHGGEEEVEFKVGADVGELEGVVRGAVVDDAVSARHPEMFSSATESLEQEGELTKVQRQLADAPALPSSRRTRGQSWSRDRCVRKKD